MDTESGEYRCATLFVATLLLANFLLHTKGIYQKLSSQEAAEGEERQIFVYHFIQRMYDEARFVSVCVCECLCLSQKMTGEH